MIIQKRVVTMSFVMLVFASCTPWKMTVPKQFSDQATAMEVQGLHSKHIRFGNYQTTKVKRGWVRTSSRRTGDFAELNMEDFFYNNFGVGPNYIRTTTKGKFSFIVEDGNLTAEVFALQKSRKNTFQMRTGNNGFSLYNLANHTEDYAYNFTASILPGTVAYKYPWKMKISSWYDKDTDTSRKMFNILPYLEERGYATDGHDSVYIRSFAVTKTETKNGKERNIPVRIKSGYELTWDGGVVCIVDAFGKEIWMYNDLEPSEKIMLAAIATAILLKDQ